MIIRYTAKAAATLVICCLLAATAALGQHRPLSDSAVNAAGVRQLLFSAPDGREAARLAERDIAARTPFLILQSGIAPVAYTTDSAFEEKFGVYYREEGCSGTNGASAQRYNARVMQYLTEQHGRAWVKVIRKDVVGLREWKKANR